MNWIPRSLRSRRDFRRRELTSYGHIATGRGLAAELDRLETRAVPSGTPINTLPDVYSFDSAGTPAPYPKNGFYINGVLAGSLPASYTVNLTLAGDFDGDGDQDVAAQVGTSWYVGLRNLGAFNFGGSAWGSLGGTNYATWIVGDFFTGTPPGGGASSLGKEDIAVRDATGQWHIAISTGTGFVNMATGISVATPSDVQKGNFDGGAEDEIFYISGTGTQVSTGTTFTVMGWNTTTSSFQGYNYGAPIAKTNYMMYMNTGVNRALVGDFNGDGLSDVVAWNRYANNANNGGMNKVWVGLSNGAPTRTFNWGPIDAGGGNTEWGYIGNLSSVWYPVVGNFNGDTNPTTGLPISDFVWFVGGNYYGLMSNGTNAFNSAVTSPPTPGSPVLMGSLAAFNPLGVNNSVMVGDFDADGDDDLFVGQTNGTGFKVISTNGATIGSSGIASVLFGWNPWINWSDYPNTYRVFNIIGKYIP